MKYKVTGPDGKAYEVNAPDGASPEDVMRYVQEQVAPGQMAEGGKDDVAGRAAALSPEDRNIAKTKNDELGEYLRAEAMQPREGETPEQRERRLYGGLSTQNEPIGSGEGVARAASQGALLGAGDEVTALMRTAKDRMTGANPQAEFGELYDAYRANEVGQLNQFRDENPVAAYGSEIIGAIPTVMSAPMNIPAQGAGLTSRLLAAGGTGAMQGGLYGFNAGEGGAAGRAENALLTAGVGGVVGAGAPVVAAGAKRLVRSLLQDRLAKSIGMKGADYRVLNRVMQADDSFTGPGGQRLAQAGGDAMLADAGPNARALLDTAIQRSGPAGTIARDAIEGRAAAAGRRVTSVLDDAFGKPGHSSSRSLIVYGDKTNPLDLIYKRAYAKPIDYTSESGRRIENMIMDRVPKEAIEAANRLMRVEGAPKSAQILASVADDGSVSFRRMPDVRQIDYITRGLNEVADQADGMGKMGGTTQTGRAYGNLSRELRTALKEQVPEYKRALDTAAGMIREGKAKEFGAVLLNARTTRADVADMVSDMGEAELRKVGEGMRMQVDETLANVKRAMTDNNTDAREAIQAIKNLSSRANREKIAAILPPEKMQRMFDEIDRAAMAFDLRAAVAQNSKTYARSAMDDAVGAQINEGPINALRSGEPVNAGKRAIQTLLGRSPADKERIADQTYSSLVESLTGPRGHDAFRVLQGMAQGGPRITGQQEQVGSLVEMLLRRNAAISAPSTQAIRR